MDARGANGQSQRIEADRPLRRDAVENRRRVLEAAANVFAVHGLDAPVEDIAQAAGVGMGTLYRRFPTKEALIEQLVGDFFESVLDAGRQAMHATDGSGFETFVRHTVSLQASHRGCISRLWQNPVPETVVAEFDHLLDHLLKRAQTVGRIRTDCTSADVMMLFWAARGIIEAGGRSHRRPVTAIWTSCWPASDQTPPSLTTHRSPAEGRLHERSRHREGAGNNPE